MVSGPSLAPEPVFSAGPEVAAVILAAGGGRRYGRPKALVEFDGRLLVERAVRTAYDGGCDPVVVVLGAAAAEVRRRADLDSARLVENPSWTDGMGSSLRVGLAALAGTEAVAAVVLLVDTPGVTSAAVRRVAGHATAGELAMGGYRDRPGHPVLLGREHWAGVAELAVGDVGARPYLRRHWAAVRIVPCADVADDADLDVPPPAPTGERR